MKYQKTQISPLAVLLILIIVQLVRSNILDTVRAVDLLQILACGILIGVLIIKVLSYTLISTKKTAA